MTLLRTERLVLSPFHERDAEELHALFTDPDIRRFLLDDEVVTLEWVLDEIAGSRERFDEDGCGLWAARETDTGPVVGFVGYRPFFEPLELQLLYGFLASHWGTGLATEAVREALRFGFDELGFAQVRAAVDTPNEASLRLLERVGMRARHDAFDGPPATALFEMSRETWRDLATPGRPPGGPRGGPGAGREQADR